MPRPHSKDVSTNRSTRARWKAAEREIAAKIKGIRVPVSGRARSSGVPDIDHPVFGTEVKTRVSLPFWLLDAMDQAKQCSKGGKIPMVVLHRVGDRFDEALVIVRLSDLDHLNLRSHDA